MPIYVDGQHVANAFVGQFLREAPDHKFFRKQASEYGFNEADYLAALNEVPVISQETLTVCLEFMCNFAAVVGLVATQSMECLRMNKFLKKRLWDERESDRRTSSTDNP